MKQEPTKTQTVSSNERKAKMNRIRKSLQDTPICLENLTNTRRFSEMPPTNNCLQQPEANLTSDSSFEQGKEKSSIGNFQIFQERYQILEKLGQGTNGVVKRCKKLSSGELFAVKSFTFEEEQLTGLKANFLILKRQRHPNIIKYKALYIDIKKRLAWLVMELVEAPSLKKVALHSEEQIKDVMFQLMDTLSYLHKHDIVHRDIKPDNILYNPTTKNIKLIDFGISKRFKKRGNLIDMWTITGELYYRAPQMFSGGYQEGVDVWSAGVLLYKIITGKTPFQSQYHNQTIRNIREKQLDFHTETETYSTQLRTLMSKMLEKNPEKRPSSEVCLADIWFSSKYEASPNRKSERLLNETNGKVSVSGKKKFRLKAAMSLDMVLDEFMSNKDQDEESLSSVRPYICRVNGQEYHCIDNEWK